MAFDPLPAIDIPFAHFGQAAVYYPPVSSAGTDCTVVPNAADELANAGKAGIVAARRRIDVRVAEIAAPVRDGTFAIGAETFKIVSAPYRDDPQQLIWKCLCDKL